MVSFLMKLTYISCIIGGFALTVDHRTPSAGCSTADITKFTQNFEKESKQYMAVMPQLQEAYENSDFGKATAVMSKVTPKYCSPTDLTEPGTFPPVMKFSALQKCIRKSQGVSVGCAACFPKYIESMMGKTGSPHTCMKKCSRVTPTTAKCLGKMQDATALQACLTPEVQKNSIPCLECSKPKLVAYANCLNMAFMNPEVQLNALLTTVKSGSGVVILRKVDSMNTTNDEVEKETDADEDVSKDEEDKPKDKEATDADKDAAKTEESKTTKHGDKKHRSKRQSRHKK